MPPKKKPAGDRHASRLVVRLPERFREPLRAVAAKNRRDMTVELQIALERYLKTEGIDFPESG